MPTFITGLKGDNNYHLNLFYNNNTCEWPIGHWVIYCIACMDVTGTLNSQWNTLLTAASVRI